MLCQDIVGYLLVKILEPDREMRNRFLRFLAYQEELSELFSFGHITMKEFKELCAHDLVSGSLS